MQARKRQKTEKATVKLFELPRDVVMHLLRFCDLVTLALLECCCANGAGYVQEMLAKLLTADLTSFCLYSQEVRPLLRKLSALTELRLDCLHIPLEELTAPASLRHLSLVLGGEDFQVDLPQLLLRLPNLTFLKLKLRNRVEKRVWEFTSPSTDLSCCVEAVSTGLFIASDFPVNVHMHSLKLRAIPQCPVQLSLTDASIQTLTRCFPGLKSLCISDYTPSAGLTDVGLRVLVKSWSNLWRLRLSSRNEEAVRQVSDLGLMTLLNHCSDLQDLSLDSFKLLTDATLAELGVACPHLNSLSLDYTNITGEGLQLLSGLGLRRLSLKGCRRVREEGLTELLKTQPGLQRVNLSCTNGVTDGVMEVLMDCSELERLTLNEAMVTDRVFGMLAEMPQLQALAVNYCADIESLHPTQLLSSLSLTRLSLVGYSELSEEDLLGACSGSLQTLRRLRVDNCRELGNSCLESLLRTCPLLQQVYMSGCRVTAQAIRRLPKLRNLKLLSLGVKSEEAQNASYKVE